jgi:hypothetical protein
MNDLLIEAPSFKDLLHAIMEDRRKDIITTEPYKYIFGCIKGKCEIAACNLQSSIALKDLGLTFTPSAKVKYVLTESMINEMIHMACDALELECTNERISWGRTSVLPKKE